MQNVNISELKVNNHYVIYRESNSLKMKNHSKYDQKHELGFGLGGLVTGQM